MSIGHNCLDLKKSILPWIEFFDEDAEIEHFYVSSVFEKFIELGAPKEDFDIEHLKDLEYSGFLNLQHSLEPLTDLSARQLAWSKIKHGCFDLVWIVDLYDEFYTLNQIHSIIKYVRENPLYDWYRIHFNNFIGDKFHYIEGFTPPRIWWVNRHGGIKDFVWENDVSYNELNDMHKASSITIPRKYAAIEHHTWNGSPESIKRKIAYQHKWLGVCSYSWDEKNNCIAFDKEYYKKFNLPVPEIKTI